MAIYCMYIYRLYLILDYITAYYYILYVIYTAVSNRSTIWVAVHIPSERATNLCFWTLVNTHT